MEYTMRQAEKMKTGKAYTAYPNMDNGYKQDNEMLKFLKK